MSTLRRLACVVLLAALADTGCQRAPTDETAAENRPNGEPTLTDSVTSRPLREAAAGDGPRFERLASDYTGLHFINPLDTSHPRKYLYHSGTACGGIAIGDVDGDGLPDIFLVSGPGTNKLYRQIGDMKFEDVTDEAGVGGGDAWGTGATMVDIDGDGDLDIYVCNFDAPNAVYVNLGDGAFVDRAEEMKLDVVDASLMASFCDYDRDGDLDMFLLTNRFERPGGWPAKDPVGVRNGRVYLLPGAEKFYTLSFPIPGRYSIGPVGRRDRLFRNDSRQGETRFTDVSRAAGIEHPGEGLSATWWDYNEDGWPDLYVGNDFVDPDRLYRNNQDGTFTDVVEQVMPHTSWNSMGADSADLNNDGRADLLIADMSATTHFMQKTTMGDMGNFRDFLINARPPQYMRNALYLNTGTRRFMEAAYLTGLDSSDWTWAVKLADFDNDGRVDVFFTNGIARSFNDSDRSFTPEARIGRTEWDLYEDSPTRPEQNLAYRNRGDLRFDDVSKAWGLDHVGMSYAAAYGDLDRDGDLDLVVANLGETVTIYRNRSAGKHRLLIRLVGPGGNRFGLGAVVRIETDSGTQVRQMMPTTGFLSCNDSTIHFGLGDDRTVSRLTVRWPLGHVQTLTNLAADRFYTIRHPETAAPQPAPRSQPKTMYTRSESLVGVRHRERPYDDYRRQPLLPAKLSQLGPGMAWSDVDGDGDDDLYLGAAAGDVAMLRINMGDGRFRIHNPGQFEGDRACEDMGAVFFDVDGDGDADLYVVSGGVECEPGDEVLRDRLYLNDGAGNFSKAPVGTIPDLRDSGGVVVAGDFDADNDLDLFVGGRVIPGKYPLSPSSRLLRNDDGRLVDVTQQLAPALLKTGLVTGALWSDADGDGRVDLLVTHEWGPVKLFRNDGGRLVDMTQQAGLADRLGWWNGITGRDLDGDGDVDYVVTNFGLNTKYHASKEKPALLYYGDFDGKGTMRLVEAEFEDKKLFPVRGKSCSTHAMPHLGDKFSTYKGFAIAELPQIYTPKCLNEAHRFAADTLESGVLLNDGKGHFRFLALPRLAQIAPAFGVVLTEVNGDGVADLYLVNNFFSPQPETGRMDGGLSLLLLGRGDGSFDPVWPDRSGLIVPGDSKGLATTDLNDDGWPDFVVGVNDDVLSAFQHNGRSDGRVVAVHLEGPKGNPTAVGARVTAHLSDGSTQTAEIYAGSGYLSQSTTTLTFGLGASRHLKRLKIVWPDGRKSEATEVLGKSTLQVKYPD